MKYRVVIIAYDEYASLFYKDLVSGLFGEYIEVIAYAVGGGAFNGIKNADLYVVSTDAFDNGEAFRKSLPEGAETMNIGVTFSKSNLMQLQKVPAGTKALFVNLSEKMVREAITQLNQLGVNHLELIPFYPGAADIEGVDLAITPQEARFVPSYIKKTVDLGHRVFDSLTVIEMALKLKLEHLLVTERFKGYFDSLAAHHYSLDQLYGRSMRLEGRFEILSELFVEGIIAVNEEDRVFACNSKAVEITGVNRNLVVGASVAEIFPDIPFAECRREMRRMDGLLIKMGDTAVNVAIVPVFQGGVYSGAIAMLQRFEEQERKQQRLRAQLLDQGHKAKYSFEDIKGNSPAIKKTIAVAKKMASGHSSILITGESGTGKEMFAHAVHKASPRAGQPFIAINCGAMPDTLLESELFGYEEGAFTGAKKGGKQGLFEFAHLGTMFLDEVDAMSPALQVRMLRVIQEREVMRLGGRNIIRVDVRIVAACNRQLEPLLCGGEFRRDLYYRLNTLPVHVPPLRERKEDIMPMFEYFCKKLGASFRLGPGAAKSLLEYGWPGNIRELGNYVEYFYYLGKKFIDLDDFPPVFFAGAPQERWPQAGAGSGPAARGEPETWVEAGIGAESFLRLCGRLQHEYRFVLACLNEGRKNKIQVGRDNILQRAEERGLPLSQREVRNIMAHLDTMGFIKIYKGRGGSKLTPKGLELLRQLGAAI